MAPWEVNLGDVASFCQIMGLNIIVVVAFFRIFPRCKAEWKKLNHQLSKLDELLKLPNNKDVVERMKSSGLDTPCSTATRKAKTEKSKYENSTFLVVFFYGRSLEKSMIEARRDVEVFYTVVAAMHGKVATLPQARPSSIRARVPDSTAHQPASQSTKDVVPSAEDGAIIKMEAGTGQQKPILDSEKDPVDKKEE